jgi:hypothetical protein
MTQKHSLVRITLALLVVLGSVMAAHAAEPDSKRLIRARDFIADEQWTQAIDLLRSAVDDPKEPRRDEALYWLAHSQHHSGDSGASLATISRLERDYPSSMWVKPGQALRIEIAVVLKRSDVLWMMVSPRPAMIAPKPPVRGPSPAPAATDAPPPPAPAPVAAPPKPVTPPKPGPWKGPRPEVAFPESPAMPMWYVPGFEPDGDLKVQALGGLMRTDADKVIPILTEMAFEADKPMVASRAVLVLAQSPLPKARAMVVRVAQAGPEPVRVSAVRYLAQFGGRDVSGELMQVFVTANEPVKSQIVKSLGELEQPMALIRIIQSEKEGTVRRKAFTSLGRAGGAKELAAMYKTASFESKRSIIDGLFTARADTQLIQVAEAERTGNSQLRREAVQRLWLLDTPQAIEYVKREPLQKIIEKR